MSRKYVKHGRVTAGAEASFLINRLRESRSYHVLNQVTYFRDDALELELESDLGDAPRL